MTSNAFRVPWDAIIVGSRCAGAATAMLLARAGAKVLVVDRGMPEDDCVSTHALMRGAVTALHRWGLLDAVRAAQTPAITTTTFHYHDDDPIELPIKARDGVDALYAPRRTLLDPLLTDAAGRAGAVVRHGVRVVDLLRDSTGRVSGIVIQGEAGAREEIRAPWVIGADGISSTIARLTRARRLHVGRHAAAVAYGYFADPSIASVKRGYHWYYRDGISAGSIPTNDGRVCTFVATPQPRFVAELLPDPTAGHARLLEEAAPWLAARLAAPLAPVQLFAGRRGVLRQAFGPGWALVGDAGFFRDPITAHGITDALRDAELLAQAITRGREEDLGRYQAERDALAVPLLEISDAIASFSWSRATIEQHHLALAEVMRTELAVMRHHDSAAA